jgi:hypothetical protein
MAGKTRIPRTRGAMSGLLLILLGIWGALIPFVGPYFHYAYTPDKAWTYTTGRLWLEILPGIAVALGGFIVLASARRPLAILGAFVAVLGGAWFVVGNLLSALWNHGIPEAGIPVGGNLTRLALEELGFFIGLGVIIVFFAALALGRFAVVGVKETALAERDAAAVAADGDAVADQPSGPVTGQPAGPFANTDDRLQPAGAAFPAGPEQSPAATSQFPVTETEAPAAETEAPAAVTQAPAAETEAPAAETEAPAAVTQAPAAVTQAPAADTQPPAAETLAPAERGPFTPASEYPPSAPFPSGGTTTTGA